MRRRMIVGLMGVLAASSLVIGSSMTVAGAQTDPPKAAKCGGDTKKKAIKQVKLAYTHFLDGAKYPDAKTDKEPYIQYLQRQRGQPGVPGAVRGQLGRERGSGRDDVGGGQQGEVHQQEGCRRRLRPGDQR